MSESPFEEFYRERERDEARYRLMETLDRLGLGRRTIRLPHNFVVNHDVVTMPGTKWDE